jgi:hypothetical protein
VKQSHTSFVQEVKFTGLLSFFMGEDFVAKSIGIAADARKGFNEFNDDFKPWLEQAKIEVTCMNKLYIE